MDQTTHDEYLAGLQIFQKILAIAGQAKNLTKDVHFKLEVGSSEKEVLHLANDSDSLITLKTKEKGYTMEEMVGCSYLIVAPVDYKFTPGDKTTIVEQVTIKIADAVVSFPSHVEFETDNDYFLSDGYSVKMCKKLTLVQLLKVAGVPTPLGKIKDLP